MYSGENLFAITISHAFADIEKHIFVDGPQKGKQVGHGYRFFFGGKQGGLVQKSHGVSETAAGAPGYKLQGAVFNVNVFLIRHIAQMLGEVFVIDQAEHEALAATDDCRWNFMFFRGGQYENDLGRRLFNGLEESIESFLGEHVAFVYDVELEAAALGHQRCSFDENAGVIHGVIGSGVDFQNRRRNSLFDFHAHGTDHAGFSRGSLFAVERLSQDTGARGFSGTAGTCKQIGMSNAIVVDGIG